MNDATPPCQVGDRIALIEMGMDPHSGKADPCPVPSGTEGTVTFVTFLQRGEWQIGVNWDADRSLMLIYPTDSFHVIAPLPESQGPQSAGHDLPTCRACGWPGTDDHQNCPNCQTA